MCRVLSRESSYNSLMHSSLMSYTKETKPLTLQECKLTLEIPRLDLPGSRIQPVVLSEEQSEHDEELKSEDFE